MKNSDPCEQREQLLLQVRSPEEGFTPRAYSHMAQGHERHGCDQAVGNNTTGKHRRSISGLRPPEIKPQRTSAEASPK